MTQFVKCFSELDKFPVCSHHSCVEPLLIQNRFVCSKCSHVFCGIHRFDWKHQCPSLQDTIHTSLSTESSKPIAIPAPPKCSENGCNCKLTGINKFFCADCGKNYCTAHRLNFVHKCVKLINN